MRTKQFHLSRCVSILRYFEGYTRFGMVSTFLRGGHSQSWPSLCPRARHQEYARTMLPDRSRSKHREAGCLVSLASYLQQTLLPLFNAGFVSELRQLKSWLFCLLSPHNEVIQKQTEIHIEANRYNACFLHPFRSVYPTVRRSHPERSEGSFHCSPRLNAACPSCYNSI